MFTVALYGNHLGGASLCSTFQQLPKRNKGDQQRRRLEELDRRCFWAVGDPAVYHGKDRVDVCSKGSDRDQHVPASTYSCLTVWPAELSVSTKSGSLTVLTFIGASAQARSLGKCTVVHSIPAPRIYWCSIETTAFRQQMYTRCRI